MRRTSRVDVHIRHHSEGGGRAGRFATSEPEKHCHSTFLIFSAAACSDILILEPQRSIPRSVLLCLSCILSRACEDHPVYTNVLSMLVTIVDPAAADVINADSSASVIAERNNVTHSLMCNVSHPPLCLRRRVECCIRGWENLITEVSALQYPHLGVSSSFYFIFSCR